MAIINDSNQYRYTGKGPLDAKVLVKKYSDLLSINYAYNGMIVSVWNDSTNNGIYILRDPAVTSALGTPDVSNKANWHRITETAELLALEGSVKTNTNAIADLLNKQLKASDEITIAADGTLGIGQVNVNKLVQTKGEELILSGGSAQAQSE